MVQNRPSFSEHGNREKIRISPSVVNCDVQKSMAKVSWARFEFPPRMSFSVVWIVLNMPIFGPCIVGFNQ
jgi:hypothetical protein